GGDRDAAVTGGDLLGGAHDRLRSRAAGPRHGQRRTLDGHARFEGDLAADERTVVIDDGDEAEHEVVDRLRIDPRALEAGAGRMRSRRRKRDVPQRLAEIPE